MRCSSFNGYGRSQKGTQNGPRSWRAGKRYRDRPRWVKYLRSLVPDKRITREAIEPSHRHDRRHARAARSPSRVGASPRRRAVVSHASSRSACRRVRARPRSCAVSMRASIRAPIRARRVRDRVRCSAIARVVVAIEASIRIDSDRSSWYEMRRNDCDENSLALTSHPTGRLHRFRSPAGPRFGLPLVRRHERRSPMSRRAPPISRPILNATAKGGECHSEEEEGRQEEREEESLNLTGNLYRGVTFVTPQFFSATRGAGS